MKLIAKRPVPGFAFFILALLLQGCAKSERAVAEELRVNNWQDDTPVHVIINVPVGQEAPAGLEGRVADWRKAGILSGALWVNSALENKQIPGFASLLTLEFPSQRAYSAWFEKDGKELAAPLIMKRADVLSQEKLAAYDPTITIFKVNYYTPKLSRELSRKWVNGYLEKYLHAQLQAGILVTYTMYLEHEAEGQGRMLLVLQYHDATIAKEGEAIKSKLNNELAAKDSHYSALADAKEKVRAIQSATLAKYQPLPKR